MGTPGMAWGRHHSTDSNSRTLCHWIKAKDRFSLGGSVHPTVESYGYTA